MPSLSSASTSTGSAATITPSLSAREQADARSMASTTPEDDPFITSSALPPPDRGPKLYVREDWSCVSDVFEYIVRRVVKRWKYEERAEARRLHMQETSAADTLLSS